MDSKTQGFGTNAEWDSLRALRPGLAASHLDLRKAQTVVGAAAFVDIAVESQEHSGVFLAN